MRNSLVFIADELNATGGPWLLTGRTAAALQGVIIHSNALSFMTTSEVCDIIGNKLEAFRTQKVKHRDLGPWKGWIGTFRHESIDAAIIGDPEFAIGNRSARIPIDDIFFSIDPFEVSLSKVWLMPRDWLTVMAYIENDRDLLEALIKSGITRDQFRTITDTLGLTYVLKSDIEAIF